MTIKQPKSGQTCKKAMANRFKTNRVIRCEHDESKSTGCQCSKFAERIAAEMNTAKNELLPLTPSCGENGQNNQEMENWQLHCDRNGNGLIEDGEVVETVKVITKPNSNYCKVKKTVSAGLKCTKPPSTGCLCENFWDTVNYEKEFKKEAKRGIKIEVECLSGNTVFDRWRITALKNGVLCSRTKKVTLKHNNELPVCGRKLVSSVKNFVKEDGFAESC